VSRNPWSRVPLAAVCASADDIKCGPFGTQLNKDEFREEGVPLWGIKQVNVNFAIPTKEFLEPRTAKRLQQYDLKPGDIVMTRKGTVGNCAVYPDHFDVGIMHSDLLRLRVDTRRCEPTFLVHQLHHSPDVERQLSLISGGAIMPGINVGRLKQLEVVLPPLAEQRRIAEVLDRAEALRAKRRAALAQLDSLTQALFLDLFGDPATNPKGWPVQTIRDLCEVKGGKRLPKGEEYSLTSTPFRYIRVTDLKDGVVNEAELAYLKPEVQAKISRYIVNTGDVIISIAGSIGLIAPVPASLDGANLTENAAKLVPRDRKGYEAGYLASLLRTPVAQNQIGSHIGQVTIGKLALFRIEKLTVPIPPVSLQREFARRATVVEKLKAAHRASLAELDALFASLQHRAFRGEL
jgi:restriction endonuclease S subunit